MLSSICRLHYYFPITHYPPYPFRIPPIAKYTLSILLAGLMVV